jgi:acyl dehydratase
VSHIEPGIDLSALGVTVEDGNLFDSPKEHSDDFAAVAGPSLRRDDGSAVHPLYAVVPPTGILQVAQKRLLRSVPGPVHDVHASSYFHLHALLRPPTKIRNAAAPIAIFPTPVGTATLVRLWSWDADGTLLWEQYNTSIALGMTWVDKLYGDPGPEFTVGQPQPGQEPTSIPIEITSDAPERFAVVQRDNHPMHYDDAFAKAAGYPGIIAHGTHTLALSAAAIITEVAPDNPASLKVFGGRLSGGAMPGSMLTLRLWPDQGNDRQWSFDLIDGSGKPILKRGVAAFE